MHDSLIRVARGEILDDEWSRLVYSVDASGYEIMPDAILCPFDEGDVQRACEYCTLNKMPLAARGAGTGLLGQCLSDGIVLDFTKHMNRVLEIEHDHVVVQPGLVKAVLDRELHKKGKFLPPDPASSNYCTIGGMIANNSSGVHCLGYGNTIDFLEEVKVVYADGTTGIASTSSQDKRIARLRDLLDPHIPTIEHSYPLVKKNSCGYRLDAVISRDGFLPHKIFAASEGTLAVVTEARFGILDIPEKRCMLVLGFSDLIAALSEVPAILRFCPVALEMMDHTVFPEGSPDVSPGGCLLFVEFAGSSLEPEKRLESCRQALAGKCSVLEYATDEASLAKIWSARKGALNNIMKLTLGSRKPVGLIEDTVVRPESLAEHAAELLRTYRQNNLSYVMYGHVGDGNMHTRPLIDLSSKSELELMERIAAGVFAKVISVGGTITGEHGDGIARLPYIPLLYGRDMARLFLSVKKFLDPGLILNPGKKVPLPWQ
ncbi:MAG: FAD-binding oxidoreductase [Nitrososphaera sp.]|nr:FAD-binding oxidoreductase [Nitrososphaera sp.]